MKRVVVTRPRHQSATLIEELTRRGADVIELPVIEIMDPDSFAMLDAALGELERGAFAAVAFTSANAVVRVMPRLTGLGGAVVAAVGDATRQALVEAGADVAVVPKNKTGAGLAEALRSHLASQPNKRILMPRAQGAPLGTIDSLRHEGLEPVEVPAYRNIPADTDTAEATTVRTGKFDVVTFASGSALRAFAAHVADPVALGLAPAQQGPAVAVIGPATARAAEAANFRVDAIAENVTDVSLADAAARVWDAAGIPDVRP